MATITLIPTGGLCNRLRAIASTLHVAKENSCTVHVVWNRYDQMNAKFKDLFKPIDDKCVSLEESNSWIYNINRKKEYYIRFLPLRFKYDRLYFQPTSFNGSNRKIIDDIKTGNGINILSISGAPLCKNYHLAELFTPVDDIARRINDTTSQFGKNTIGIHIRRTDNVESIDKSPLEAFKRNMDDEVAKDDNVSFYLASDDNSVKEQLKAEYGDRIITSIDNTDRDNSEGIKFAVYDLFCLSRTRRIIGSYYSSYTQEAARLGHIQLDYARK